MAPDLPLSSYGTPKRAAPWIAAALPHIAAHSCGVGLLTAGRVEAAVDGSGAGRMSFHIDSSGSQATTCILSLFVERLGYRNAALRLSSWSAVRKHLTPAWWRNTSKGGNEHSSATWSATYVEAAAGIFQTQADALAKFTARDGQTGVQHLHAAIQQWQADGQLSLRTLTPPGEPGSTSGGARLPHPPASTGRRHRAEGGPLEVAEVVHKVTNASFNPGSRPAVFNPDAGCWIFKEPPKSSVTHRRSADGDSWKHNGGKKVARLLSAEAGGAPVVRRRYGSIMRRGEHKAAYRYMSYTLLEPPGAELGAAPVESTSAHTLWHVMVISTKSGAKRKMDASEDTVEEAVASPEVKVEAVPAAATPSTETMSWWSFLSPPGSDDSDSSSIDLHPADDMWADLDESGWSSNQNGNSTDSSWPSDCASELGTPGGGLHAWTSEEEPDVVKLEVAPAVFTHHQTFEPPLDHMNLYDGTGPSTFLENALQLEQDTSTTWSDPWIPPPLPVDDIDNDGVEGRSAQRQKTEAWEKKAALVVERTGRQNFWYTMSSVAAVTVGAVISTHDSARRELTAMVVGSGFLDYAMGYATHSAELVDNAFNQIGAWEHFRAIEMLVLATLALVVLLDALLNLQRFAVVERLSTLLIRQLMVRCYFLTRSVLVVSFYFGIWGWTIFPIVELLAGLLLRGYTSSVPLAPAKGDASRPPVFGTLMMLMVTTDSCVARDPLPCAVLCVRGAWGLLHRCRAGRPEL